MRKGTPLLTLPLVLLTCVAPAFAADQSAAGAGQAAPAVTIKVVDAGGAPKAALRYAPSVGDLQTIVLSISTKVTNQMGNLPMPTMKLPTNVSTLTVRVDEVADGRITANIRVDDEKLTDTADVEPMIVKQMESTIGNSIGQSAKLVLSDRGIGESFSFNENAKADPTAAQTLSSLESTLNMLLTPLPEEPIGPGARWTATTKVEQQAFDASQTVTYTLKGISDGVLHLEIKIEQSADPQDASMPGAPPGTQVKLTALSLEGSGTATVSLKDVAPTEAGVTSSGTQEIDITQTNGGPAQHFKRTMDVHATVAPKGAEEPKGTQKEDEGTKEK